MNMTLKYALFFMLFSFALAVPTLAVQEEASETKIKQNEEDEDENSKSLKRALEKMILFKMSDDIDYLFNSKTLLDLSALKVKVSFDSIASPKLTIKSRLLKLLPLFIISPDIPDPFIGSPAYDGISTPRKSLNIDPVTGKYYWEW